MGCCCSRADDEDRVELTGTDTNTAVCCKIGQKSGAVQVSHDDASDSYYVSGNGTAAGSCTLDCDTACWEVKLGPNPQNIRIGLKRMLKGRDHRLNGQLDDAHEGQVDSWTLQGYEGKEGDVIGVYWDQTDKPMLFFTVNGKQLDVGAVNRVCPANDVYPAVSVADGGSCTVTFNENFFAFPPVYRRFGPIICATSLI